MSLMSALHVGRSGLAVNQAAVQTAGNNLANSATEGYSRQSAIRHAATGVEISPGIFVGTGVRLQSIVRNVDEALNARVRTAVSDHEAAKARYELLSQLETIANELGDSGLSHRLNEFFNTWSELSNNPTDSSVQTLVIQQGANLAGFMQDVREDLDGARAQLDDRIRDTTASVNNLVKEIAGLNVEIATSEGGRGGGENGLRDERDQLIRELSTLVDVTTNDQPGGGKDVLINGIPVVYGKSYRTLEADYQTDESGTLNVQMRLEADGTFMDIRSGTLGALLTARENDMLPAIDALDQFAGALIYQVNRVHTQGQGGVGFNQLTGAYAADDPAASLTATAAGLDFVPRHGSFQLHVTQQSTGIRTTTQIDVDLDGLNGADMSLDDLATAIDGVANISASVDVEGRLNVTADSGDFSFSFSDDTSGVLAATGLNVFFTGGDAGEIAINQRLLTTPAELATTTDHVAGGNGTALAIAALQQTKLDDLGGRSLNEMWADHVSDYAVRTSQADLTVDSANLVVQSLDAQRSSVSGVSVDEEAINLMAYQRAYQGSARFINVVDQLMDAVLAMAR